jgi:DnaJ-class molecular chaperone
MNNLKAHEILGTSPRSSPEEIKKAYRRASMKHHPDRGGDAEAFKEAKAAFEHLELGIPDEIPKEPPIADEWADDIFSSADKTYNEDLNNFFKRQNFHRGDRPPIEDINEDMIGSWGSSFKSSYDNKYFGRKKTLHATIKLTIREAFSGCNKTIAVPNPNSISGHPTSVKIPAGASEDKSVTTFETDDEIYKVFIKIVSTFRISWGTTSPEEAGDIINDLRISPITMMLGGTVIVEMIDGGEIQVNIPPGLQANKILRVRGRGYWSHQGSAWRGDCLLRAIPEIKPLKDISKEEIIKFREATGGR